MTLAPPSPRVRSGGGRCRCLSRAIIAGPPRHSLSAQNRGEAPSTHPSPRTRGEGAASGAGRAYDVRSRSRRASRPRFADQSHEFFFASKKMKGGGAPVGATVSWGLATQRMTPSLCASGEAARPSGRARLAALHRGVAEVILSSASGRVSWNHRVQTGGPSPAPVQRAPRGPARAGRAVPRSRPQRTVSVRARAPRPLPQPGAPS